jgi:hypothetical protein
MTDNINETTTSLRMATRSTTTAAAAAAAAITAKTTNTKTGHERLAQLYDDIHLPTKWNGKEKASTLVLQQNDLVVTYKGKSFRDNQSR